MSSCVNYYLYSFFFNLRVAILISVMRSTQPSDQPGLDISPRSLGGSPQWPGERDPTRWDVHDANQILATTFLERFKTVLLHSEEAQGCRSLISPLARDVLQAPSLGGNASDDLQAGMVSPHTDFIPAPKAMLNASRIPLGTTPTRWCFWPTFHLFQKKPN